LRKWKIASANFAFYQVVRRHYSGEVSEFISYWCDISSGYCSPKLSKSIQFLTIIQNIKLGGSFWDTVYYYY